MPDFVNGKSVSFCKYALQVYFLYYICRTNIKRVTANTYEKG